MRFEYAWGMPSKWTFECKPIRKWLNPIVMNGINWADPFCGEKSWVEYRNDLNPNQKNAHSHLEALEFLSTFSSDSLNGVIFDPPYSLTQVSRSYSNIGLKFKGKENPTGGFPKVKDQIARIVKPGGLVISFGWNTVGMGKKRHFIKNEILIVSHGGNRNDTLCLLEENKKPYQA